mmetsp:Transcript_35571/g.115823  ORF Transcript_35571/g.115823 Transcript_35571/m.115823 type:complete len:209 (+) Transcript_35571:67-693(+)
MCSSLRPGTSASSARSEGATAASLKLEVVVCAVHEMRRSPATNGAFVSLHLPRPLVSVEMATPSRKHAGCCQTITCRPTIHDSIPTRFSPCWIGSRQRRHLLRPVFAASMTMAGAGVLSLTGWGVGFGGGLLVARTGLGMSSPSLSSPLASSPLASSPLAESSLGSLRDPRRPLRRGNQSGSADGLCLLTAARLVGGKKGPSRPSEAR